MKAIILAAGQGTRLKKYTKNLPKGMLNFMGKTLIERQIELYLSCGINEIIIVKGFAGDKIKYDNIKYYTNENYSNTNMVESLLTAKSEFNDDIVISYSDILFEKSMLKKMIEFNEANVAVAVDDNWKNYWLKRYGNIEYDTESLTIDNKNNIISIGEENPVLEKIDARYIGLLKFSKTGLEQTVKILEKDYESYSNKPWKQSGKNIREAYMTDLLQAIIDNGHEVKAVRFKNGWLELDTNEDYEKACKWAESGELKDLIDQI